jgi:uncharacterized short protein YbdD (DUF466 family)
MKAAAICEHVWRWLRAVTGDAAYENYVRRIAKSRPEARALTAREFYLDTLRRRYNTINRCC